MLHDVDATHLPIRAQIPPLGRRRALGVSAKKCVGSSSPKESVVYFAIWQFPFDKCVAWSACFARPLSIAAVLGNIQTNSSLSAHSIPRSGLVSAPGSTAATVPWPLVRGRGQAPASGRALDQNGLPPSRGRRRPAPTACDDCQSKLLKPRLMRWPEESNVYVYQARTRALYGTCRTTLRNRKLARFTQ